MRIETTAGKLIVHFTSSEVSAIGLRKRGAYVQYAIKGGCLLDDYSAWLVNEGCAPAKVDALIARADAAIEQPCHQEVAA